MGEQVEGPADSAISRGAGFLQAESSTRNKLRAQASNEINQQEIFMLPRQKSRSRERRDSRLFLVDGQLCWSDDAIGTGYHAGKRNSSVGLMFGSSMDLSGIGQSIDSSGGAGSEEAISYRIKWCRENIMKLKQQTWPMEKKLQVLKASKLFIKQHQGELKQSKQAKDVLASTTAIFERYWRHFKREFANFLVIITPWEMRIKKIESHFGSVVASYFTFLRWIFWLNLANSLVMVAFVMVPELIENVPDLTGLRKGELGMQQPMGPAGRPLDPPEFNPKLGEMWEFEGFLKFSPIFYGYYSNVEISRSGFWRNPLAYLMSAILTYLFCFFCISRKLSQNTKLSRIGSKDDEYTFCWTVFVGWDFMIGNSETAYNKTSSLVMNLKEGILEEKEQTKDRDWRLIIRRVFANVLTLMLIVASAYVVTLAVQRSENLPEDASLLQKNELQLVMSGIQFMFPPLFDVIGIIEKYHPRKALSWQLGRILFLDFLNFYTLMFSLFGTVDQMGNQLGEVSGNITLLRKNATYFRNLFTTTTTTTALPSETTTATISTLSIEQTTTGSPPNLTSANSTELSNQLNFTTILTSVLLASSTISPQAQQTTNASNELLSSTPLSVSQFAPTSGSPIAISSTLATTSLPEVISSPVVAITSASSSLESPKIVTEPLQPPATTVMSANVVSATSPQTTSTTAKGLAEDEDYPDLSEAIKVIQAGSKLNRKRRKVRLGARDEYLTGKLEGSASNSEGAIASEEFTKINGEREEESSEAPSNDLIRVQGAGGQNLLRPKPINYLDAGAYLPPMQDPYLRRGSKSRRPQVIGAAEGRGEISGPNWDSAEEDEEDEEEPLEGRLTVKRPTTTRRPATIKQTGLARPIGGLASDRSRKMSIQRASKVQQSTTPDLDDDINEDVATQISPQSQESSLESASESTIFFEPTTAQVGAAIDSNVRPDYSIMDSTTIKSVFTDADNRTGGGSTLAPGISEIASNVETSTASDTSQGTTQLTTSCTISSDPSRTSPSMDEFLVMTNASMANLKKSKSIGFNASEVKYTDCLDIPEFKHQEILALNSTLLDKLKTLCWETMFGQEMVKIVVMDLVMTVISAVSFEFMRACFVRYCNRFFFWDLERGFPGYQDFKIAENVLHLVNNQSTVWMGMFFAPGLPAINTVKLAVLMYVRSWAVLTCNIPHETVFKVSKSNNFYYWILLINLLICILPVAYAVTWIRPSWHCGPFGGECRMYLVFTKLVKSLLPPEANNVFRYLTSPGAVIPILISLILIIYYLASTVSSSKEANKELKAQLKKDKEQEAAVPEITNTTVVDASPPAPANNVSSSSLGAGSGAVAESLEQTSPKTNLLPVRSNPDSLAPAGATSQGLLGDSGQSAARPPAARSLLMPPSIA